MTAAPKVKRMGDDVYGVVLEGNRAKPEKAYFRVAFPGGDVDIVRTSNDDYWVHVRVDRPEDGFYVKGNQTARIVNARLDIHGKHASETNPGDFNNPNLYHAAMLIQRDAA